MSCKVNICVYILMALGDPGERILWHPPKGVTTHRLRTAGREHERSMEQLLKNLPISEQKQAYWWAEGCKEGYIVRRMCLGKSVKDILTPWARNMAKEQTMMDWLQRSSTWNWHPQQELRPTAWSPVLRAYFYYIDLLLYATSLN